MRPALFSVNPNQGALDVYTLLHVGFGAVLRQGGFGLGTTVAASLAWEWIIEPLYKERYPEIFPAPSQDTALNRMTDTVAVVAGWYMAR